MKSSCFFLIVLFTSVVTAAAAEIRFRPGPIAVDGTAVTLGELAEVTASAGDDVESLRRTMLFPAPAAGATKKIRLVELRDILSDLGIKATEHLVLGEEVLTILGPKETDCETKRSPFSPNGQTVAKPNPLRQKPLNRNLSPREMKQVETQLVAALKIYLNRCMTTDLENPLDYPWTIAVKLDSQQGRTLAGCGSIRDIYGGVNPIVGPQRFDIVMDAFDPETNRPVVVSVEALVSLPVEAVVVRRAIRKGELIGEHDVEVVACEEAPQSDYLSDVSLAVGREAIDALREGSIVNASKLRSPVLVRKGEFVTVYSKAEGITVKLTGRARQDGSAGSPILVENPTGTGRTKETFLATVTGIGTVTVNAGAAMTVR